MTRKPNFSYNDISIIKQTNLEKIPQNEIVIWKKHILVINGLYEKTNNGFRVEIEESNLISYIGKSSFYIDKTIHCTITVDNSAN